MAYGDRLNTSPDNKEWNIDVAGTANYDGAQGIASDGQYFFVITGRASGQGNGSVKVYSQFDKAPIPQKEWNLSFSQPVGCAFDPTNGHLFVLDYDAENVKRYTVVDGTSTTAPTTISVAAPSGAQVPAAFGGGFNPDGTTFRLRVNWVESRPPRTDEIRAYSTSGSYVGPVLGSVLGGVVGSANNRRISGIAITPELTFLSDSGGSSLPSRILVFNRENTPAQRPDLTIGITPDGSTSLSGLWTDGATLWGLDTATKRVRAYDVIHEGPSEESIYDIVKEIILGSQWIAVDQNEDMNRLRIRRKG